MLHGRCRGAAAAYAEGEAVGLLLAFAALTEELAKHSATLLDSMADVVRHAGPSE